MSDAIDKDSGRMYSAGHAFCKGVDAVEGDVTIGLYSELKAREENIDEINEKLLEFY